MPNETEGFRLPPEEIDRARAHMLWRDDKYLEDMTEREVAEEEAAEHNQFMDAIHQHDEELAKKAAAQAPDFQAIFEANVSLQKRTPTKRLLDEWDEKWQAAVREAGQGHTTMEGALKKQFGSLRPIIEDGRVIGLENPNQQTERVPEIPKGARSHSRRLHKSKTSRPKKLRNQPKPGRAGDKNSPPRVNQIDGERIIK